MSDNSINERGPGFNDRRSMLAGISGLAAGAILAGHAQAGPLNPPPGPIAPTPGPEPRIAINSTNTPGNAESIYRISVPGSYYLTDNITGVLATGKTGIEIASSNVSIDLMGFHITGGSGTVDGIGTAGSSDPENIRICNGVVRGWGRLGIRIGFTTASPGVILDRIVSSGNGTHGIYAGKDSVLHHCIATDNGDYGFLAGANITMHACSAAGNAGTGIYVSSNSTLMQSVARNNGEHGIECAQSCIVHRCAARENDLSGFSIGSQSVIAECVAAANKDDGIRCIGNTIIRGNQCSSNANTSFNGVGIRISGGNNRIEDNNCVSNNIGLYAAGAGNFIARNSCSDNTLNWSIVSGNVCLIVQAANSGSITGNSGGVSPGSTNPNANYTY
ncbi:MAG: hypothetical protein R3B67_14150 [Phycisphaerales bacterium]